MAKKIVQTPRPTKRPRTTAKQTASRKPAANKLDAMVAALRGSKGATISDLMDVTGWLPHSVRGAMSGALKKKRGLIITSEKRGDVRVYRIAGKA